MTVAPDQLMPDGVWGVTAAEAHSKHLWALAQRGVVDRGSVWHTPTVATQGANGAPELRTVVLRGISSVEWTLRFHTDRRSGKFEQICRSPQIAMHVYDTRQKLQVRMAGTATLHADDDIAQQAWTATQPMSRVGYAQREHPGRALPYERVTRLPVGIHDTEARANFVAVMMRVTTVDWLYLAAEGHRRAVLHRDRLGSIVGQWIAP